RDRFGIGMGFAFALDDKEDAILLRIFNFAVVTRIRFFTDHDLDADLLALAEAFFEILLGPETCAKPGFRRKKSHFVAALLGLRLEEGGKLQGFRDIGVREDGSAYPFLKITARKRERIEAPACERSAVATRRGICVVKLKRDATVTARPGELIENRAGQRHIDEIGSAVDF